MSGPRARRALVRLWVIGLLLLVSWPSTVAAQARGAQATPKLESIRRYMERGQALYASGNYLEAARVFEQGYKEHPYSAFLFNAGVAYQKLDDPARALEKFREYLRVDPSAPDAAKVRERIAKLEAEKQAPKGAVSKPSGTPPEEMKALVVVETQPPGAPLKIYVRERENAAPFDARGDNPGWQLVATATAPANLTLDVGHYHILVDEFAGYDATSTDVDVMAGRVLQFRAALSQGSFMSFLRVTSNVEGAKVYVDDPRKRRPAWGVTPYGALLGQGEHDVLVEAPGYEPKASKVELARGEQRHLDMRLERVRYGRLRIDGNVAELAVSIDGKPRGVWRSAQPALELELPAGLHRVTLTSAGYKTFSGSVDVPRGRALPLRAHMIPRYPRGAAWTQAAIGTAFLGAAIVLGVESNRLYGQIEDDRDRGVLENEDERISRGRIFAIGADIGFAIGAVLGGLATYNFIRDPYPESKLRSGAPREFDEPAGSTVLGPRRSAAPVRVARDVPLLGGHF